MVVSSSSSSRPNSTQSRGTLLLTRSAVAALLSLEDCIEAVEQALRLHAEGRSSPPTLLGIHVEGGGFHIKAACVSSERRYFAAKTNGNFPHNPERYGLPTIQGLVLLADAERGTPLAVLDSVEITAKRTAATSAIAAKHLARPDAEVATICGCGVQGRAHLDAMMLVRPIRRAYAFDLDPRRAERFAAERSAACGIEVRATVDLARAVGESAIIVTCTPSRSAFLTADWLAPGSFIAAVGADAADKHEIDPSLLRACRLVADSTEQCAEIGELHHAIAAGLAAQATVHAELHELVAGTKTGRTAADEIAIFDSTGTALQDVAAAVAVYRKASLSGEGHRIDFGS